MGDDIVMNELTRRLFLANAMPTLLAVSEDEESDGTRTNDTLELHLAGGLDDEPFSLTAYGAYRLRAAKFLAEQIWVAAWRDE